MSSHHFFFTAVLSIFTYLLIPCKEYPLHKIEASELGWTVGLHFQDLQLSPSDLKYPHFLLSHFSLLKSNLKAWEHCLVEKWTNKENRTTDLATGRVAQASRAGGPTKPMC